MESRNKKLNTTKILKKSLFKFIFIIIIYNLENIKEENTKKNGENNVLRIASGIEIKIMIEIEIFYHSLNKVKLKL